MVFTGKWSLDAVWSSNTPRWDFDPFTTVGVALGFVVPLSIVSSLWILAVVSGLDVLGIGLVEVTIVHVVGQDGNVLPWGWVPVWIVAKI